MHRSSPRILAPVNQAIGSQLLVSLPRLCCRLEKKIVLGEHDNKQFRNGHGVDRK